MTRLPTYAISHGGGPWPWAKESLPVDWTALETALAAIPGELPEAPTAVLMVTAHWETSGFRVQMAEQPGMIYDYGGFPPHTYEIQYPAPGHPAVAERVAGLLGAAGLPVGRDPQRGFDHGTFVPAYAIYPEADVPIVQLSIDRSYDPAIHLAAGRALAPLRDEGVLIIGSGLPSFHDLSSFGPAAAAPSAAFDAWLGETLIGRVGAERAAGLEGWTDAPSARRCHPREDHLVPLFVAAGAAEDEPAVRHYHETNFFGGATSSGFRFGDAAIAA